MQDIIVSAVQMPAEECWRDADAPKRNVERILAFYEDQADRVDLVVFPELAITGYIPLKGYDQTKKRLMARAAQRSWDELLPQIASVTSGRRASLVTGFLEPSTMRNEMHNSVGFFEDGELLAVHRKLHLPVEENHYFVPGDEVAVAQSRLGAIALLVCYDMVFPESARLAVLAGAEVLCVVSNWLDIANLVALGRALPVARAIESQCHVVFVNGVGELEARGRRWSLFGRSLIVSATGTVLAEADATESVITAALTADDLDAGSDVFPVLRDRRPDAYGALTARRTAFSAVGMKA